MGCATTTGRLASRALHEERYQDAIPLLLQLSTENPNDARVWARLGQAQYYADQMDAAEESLARALSLDAGMAAAHLYLGFIAEARDSVEPALWHYQVYLDRKPEGKLAEEVANRLEALRLRRATAFAQRAVRDEQKLKPKTYPDSSVGVVYFNATRLSVALRPLAKGLAEMLVTDLSTVRALHVLERLRTEELLNELKLSHTEAFDTTTAPRLGKLLGAAHVVGGDVSELGDGRLRLDPQIVSTKSGKVDLTKEQTGELAQFFRMEKQIVWDVLRELGIEASEQERDSLALIPTESFVAFLAYSRGLDFYDRGLYPEARKEFARAAKIDPSFHAAGARLRQTSHLSADGVAEPADIGELSEAAADQNEWAEQPVETDQRLAGFLGNIGLGRRQDDPNKPPQNQATVIVIGRFDQDRR